MSTYIEKSSPEAVEAVKAHLGNLKQRVDALVAETKQYVLDHADELDESTHLTIGEIVFGLENELVTVSSYIEWHPDNYPEISIDVSEEQIEAAAAKQHRERVEAYLSPSTSPEIRAEIEPTIQVSDIMDGLARKARFQENLRGIMDVAAEENKFVQDLLARHQEKEAAAA
jgi:hypothetical protein